MPNSAQPTNSIDSELAGFFKPYLQPKNVIGSQADTYTITAYGITQALQAIEDFYRNKILEARKDENQSWLAVAEHEIALGKHCYNHDKYVSQCGACRERLQFYIVAVRQKQVVEERLNNITAQFNKEGNDE